MYMTDLRDARVLVTGGTGFLGRHLTKELHAAGAEAVAIGDYKGGWQNHGYDHRGVNLTNPSALHCYFDCYGPFDAVMHVAGWNGGISFNESFPADIFYRNTMMALNVMDAAQAFKVKKVVSVVASCAYPQMEWEHEGYGDYILREREFMCEADFLDGPPHDSVACHGYAKRNLQLASHFYRQQYGLNAVCACPTTLYGPGDSYDPQRTKVMGGMVKRFCDAADRGEQEVVCWGTGQPKREFLYVEDCARLLLQVLEHYDDSSMPLNLGTGQELTVKEVAETVARGVGFSGRIGWDTTKPDGQMRKRLDLTRMRQAIPGVELTTLEEGVRRTAADYRARRVA
jgi:GDP-L-fucose synthase